MSSYSDEAPMTAHGYLQKTLRCLSQHWWCQWFQRIFNA